MEPSLAAHGSEGWSGWPVDDFSEGKLPLSLISGGDGLLFSFKTEGSC